MKPREIFVLAVRILGVWALLDVIHLLSIGIAAAQVNPVPLFGALAQIAAAIYCLNGAPHLVDFVYPNNQSSNQP